MAPIKFLGLRGKALTQFITWAVICPAYILFGWNNALAGGVLDKESWVKMFPRIDTLTTTGEQNARNAQLQGTVVSLYTLGCFFGSLSCIWLGDRLGRTRTITLGAVFNVIGSTLQASSFSLGQLIAGRIISGLGFGAMSATAPNWQSEFSKPEHRGSAVILETLVSWITYGISYATGSVTWRLPMAVSGDRLDEAREALSALNDVPEDSDQVSRAIQEVQLSLAATGQGRFLDIFTHGEQRLFHRTCLAAAGQLFQQTCGLNTIAFYVSTIFQQDLGLSGANSRVLGAAVFTWQAVVSPVGVLAVDRLGRRKLMLISCIGMGVSAAVLTGTVSQPNDRGSIIAVGVFIFIFLGLTFLYASEIAPPSVRVPITSISTGTPWLFNFMFAEVTPVGFSTISYRFYIVGAVLNFFLILPSVYFFFPETSGRSLEEVDQIFHRTHRTSRIFDAVSVSKNLPKKILVKRGAAQPAESRDVEIYGVDALDREKE